jgi:citrate lyase subunit beta/citryl-CoA lyase
MASGADAVVFDLEDAVAEARKAVARDTIVRLLGTVSTPDNPARFVRVNAASTKLFGDDLAALRDSSFDGLVLPKALPDHIIELPSWIPAVLPIIETARSLRLAHSISSNERVGALLLGAVDLRTELSLSARPDGQELLFARSQLVVDSAAAHKAPPIDSVFTAIPDLEGFRAEAVLGASLGMGGKLCIHPSQVPIANEIYSPSERAVAWALRVVQVFDSAGPDGRGVVSIDGEMVDAPVVARARRILSAASAR